MDTNRENIDRYFSDKLSGFQQHPPEEAWDNIALKLHERKKRNVLLFFFRIAAGMAILTAIGVAYYLGNQTNGTKQPNDIVQHQPVKVTNNTGTTSEQENNQQTPAAKTVQPASTGNKPADTHENGNSAILQPPENLILLTPAEQYPFTGDNASIPNPPSVTTYAEAGDYPVPAIAGGNSKLYPLPIKTVFVPSAVVPLTYNRQTDIRIVTPEEAAALLLAQYGYTSETEKEAEKNRAWSFGTEMAPLYSYRNIYSEKSYAATVEEFNESESGVMAYAGGVKIAVTSGKRLTIQSGMYYSRYGQRKTSAETYYNTFTSSSYDGNDVNEKSISVVNSTGVIKGETTDQAGNRMVLENKLEPNTMADNVENRYYSYLNTPSAINVETDEENNTTLDQYFEYVELPFLLKYKIIDRRFDFSFSGGLVTNILVGTKIFMNNDAIDAVTEEITTVNYLGSVGLGFEYPIYRHFAFTLEPRFRYYFNPIDKSAGYNVHPYSFGIFAGFNYLF